MVEFKFFGTGDSRNGKLHSTSAYLEFGEYDENALIMNVGETTFKDMMQLGFCRRKRNLYICITSYEIDNIASLPSLLDYCYDLNINVKVYSHICNANAVKMFIKSFCKKPKELEVYGISRLNDVEDLPLYVESVNIQDRKVCIEFSTVEDCNDENKYILYDDTICINHALMVDFAEGAIDLWYRNLSNYTNSYKEGTSIPEFEKLLMEMLYSRGECGLSIETLKQRVICINISEDMSSELLIQNGYRVAQKEEVKSYMNRDFTEDVKNYRDTKSISYRLVDIAMTRYIPESISILYRGDCVYPGMLQLGKKFKFHNHITSWSEDRNIAVEFSNTGCAPDWYFDEDEWDSTQYRYPFKKYIDEGENLAPVLFTLRPTGDLRGIRTSDYIDVNEDTEYVSGDEKEIILGTTDFYVTGVSETKDTKGNVLYLVELATTQKVLSFPSL